MNRTTRKDAAILNAIFRAEWQEYKAFLRLTDSLSAIVPAIPPAKECLRALKSAAYAKANHPEIEAIGFFDLALVMLASKASATDSLAAVALMRIRTARHAVDSIIKP